MPWVALTFRLALRAALRPALALDLLRVAWRFRTRGWYARPPFLPLPDHQYMAWRMYTAYGKHDAIPPIDDIVRYARWARNIP